MFCGKCGVQNEDNARFCRACGAEMMGAKASDVKSAAAKAVQAKPVPQKMPSGTDGRHKKVGIIAVAVVVVVAAVGAFMLLGDKELKKDAYTFSEILKSKSPVIFYTVDEISKDEDPGMFYIFEDEQLTTIANINDLTLGELSAMKDDEIIETAKDALIKADEKEKQEFLNDCKTGIANYKNAEAKKSTDELGDEDHYYKGYAYQETPISEEDFMRVIEGVGTRPFTTPYSIGINTDATGNHTESETLYYANGDAPIDYEGECWPSDGWKYTGIDCEYLDMLSGDEEPYYELTMVPAYGGAVAVYDSYYASFIGDYGDEVEDGFYFVVRVGNENVMLNLDEPGAKGTETDPDIDKINETYHEVITKRIDSWDFDIRSLQSLHEVNY